MGRKTDDVELLELGKDISYVRMNGKEIPIDTKRFVNMILLNIKELKDEIERLKFIVSPVPDDNVNS